MILNSQEREHWKLEEDSSNEKQLNSTKYDEENKLGQIYKKSEVLTY